MQEHCIRISSNICFGYLLESPHGGDTNKNTKHIFYEELRIKQGFPNISFCLLRSLYNSKFIIVATSGNKCCRCNESSLFVAGTVSSSMKTVRFPQRRFKTFIPIPPLRQKTFM